MKFLINVTPHDIKKGKRTDIYSCPIARAVRRHDPLRKREARVGTSHVMWQGGSFPLPKEAYDFRLNFDWGAKVEPFSFVMTLPDNAFDEPQADGTQG
jgi:hypothetical protein